MKKQYYLIFEDLYRDRFDARRTGWPDATGEVLRALIDRAIDDANLVGRVRPDARYFLLVNFTEMVLRPLAAGGDIASGDLQIFEARDDLKRILNWAREESTRRQFDATYDQPAPVEISARDVISAIARNWDQIAVNKLDAWG